MRSNILVSFVYQYVDQYLNTSDWSKPINLRLYEQQKGSTLKAPTPCIQLIVVLAYASDYWEDQLVWLYPLSLLVFSIINTVFNSLTYISINANFSAIANIHEKKCCNQTCTEFLNHTPNNPSSQEEDRLSSMRGNSVEGSQANTQQYRILTTAQTGVCEFKHSARSCTSVNWSGGSLPS